MPTPPASAPPAARSSATLELRRHLLHLVLAVVALDAAAIALQRALGVDGWPRTRQQAFTVAWVALTLVVVSVFLQRVRVTRVRARRARAGLR